MAKEIERKFLVRSDAWRAGADAGTLYRQGYLHSDESVSVRVRLAGDKAFLTIKGGGAGISRSEFEYPVPPEDASEILDALCHAGSVEKTRHLFPAGRHTWEIDVFAGRHAGLVLAEIELSSEDEPFDRPDWLGEEVTGDPRYLNSNLAKA
jgi:CYTH domain-containing protein